jgi:hypothetical protein
VGFGSPKSEVQGPKSGRGRARQSTSLPRWLPSSPFFSVPLESGVLRTSFKFEVSSFNLNRKPGGSGSEAGLVRFGGCKKARKVGFGRFRSVSVGLREGKKAPSTKRPTSSRGQSRLVKAGQGCRKLRNVERTRQRRLSQKIFRRHVECL